MTLPCDLCGETESLDTPGDPTGKVRICSGCGFVHVKERRSLEEVAKAWEDIYEKELYSPDWPAVKARLFYVAEWLDQTLGLLGKSVLDIGAGNGLFLDYCHRRGAAVTGLDPSPDNCGTTRTRGFECIEGWASAETFTVGAFDIVTLNWTLENTANCIEVLEFARRNLKPGGHVVVATGSRILVPFKKPLSSYLGSGTPPDTHCFRWSSVSLTRALALAGLTGIDGNDRWQNDVMVCWAKEGPPAKREDILANIEPAAKVHNFFTRWQREWP